MAMPYASLSPAGDYCTSPAGTASLLPFCRASPFSSAGSNGVGEDAQIYGRWMARPLPFTAAQHEELQQQALIYKHLVAGVPVPPELVLPIRRGIESLAARFYDNPIVAGYGSYLGKKVDPEPGRCRRTDGKKWRCAKEAASDSKYCERHMHRGKNRSRKPVETQLVPQPPAASATSPLGVFTNGNGFPNHSLYPAIGGNNGGGGGNNMSSTFSALGSSQLHMGNASPYAALGGAGGTCKDLRYAAYGTRSFANEHSQIITEAAFNTSMENAWRQQPSQTSPFPLSSYPQLGAMGQNNTVKGERQQLPLSFLGSGDFGTWTPRSRRTRRSGPSSTSGQSQETPGRTCPWRSLTLPRSRPPPNCPSRRLSRRLRWSAPMTSAPTSPLPTPRRQTAITESKCCMDCSAVRGSRVLACFVLRVPALPPAPCACK